MSGPTDFYAVVAGRHYDYTSTTYELDNALTSTIGDDAVVPDGK